ncbi:MAG TPA: hypothetical protein PLF81_27140, partial [Candidatus Anammoximicrobium sp.]|nr:hypothetical protein [Candidatus Anammoximicrobium sp.]
TEICNAVRTALESDEHAVALAPVLKDRQAQAVRLLAKAAKAKTEPVDELKKPKKVVKLQPGRKIVSQGEQRGLAAQDGKQLLADLQRQLEAPSRRLSVTWRIDEESH